jgi:hypothetical protein
MNRQSPPRQLLTPIDMGERFFPDGAPCGFYPDPLGRLHPNVTSVLSNRWPFKIEDWAKYEPAGFDCEAARDAAASTGTAVHAVCEQFLLGRDVSGYEERLQPWVEPLLSTISRASAVLGVELPIAGEHQGLRYAGSCDALLLAPDNRIVVVDFKTRRCTAYKKPGPNRPNLKYLDKQKAQVACYASTISQLYADQLPAPVTRATLLFAVPGDSTPTAVSIAGDELQHYIRLWQECLSSFYQAHEGTIEQVQESYDASRLEAAA